MIVVTVSALTVPTIKRWGSDGRADVTQPMAFKQQFDRKIDADDYVAFWRRLGCCHIKRSTSKQKVQP